MSLRVARRLADPASLRVVDLRWLAPLPVRRHLAAADAPAGLVVDETRRTGGVGEGVVTALVEAGFGGPILRVASQDSFIPLGPAARHRAALRRDREAAFRVKKNRSSCSASTTCSPTRSGHPGHRARIRRAPGPADHRRVVRARRTDLGLDARGRCAGLLGMHLKGYGCAGANAVAYGTGLSGAGGRRLRRAQLVSVQGSLAMFAIWKFGSEEQKTTWLPRMAAGEAIGCFGLTEPDYGSDPAGMRTRRQPDGDDWVLNGTKMWITNGRSPTSRSSGPRPTTGSAASWSRPMRRGSRRQDQAQEAVAARLGHLELVLTTYALPASAMLPEARVCVGRCPA